MAATSDALTPLMFVSSTTDFPVLGSTERIRLSSYGHLLPATFPVNEMIQFDVISAQCVRGKTHAMTAIGAKACSEDFRVRFFTLTSLVMMLRNAGNGGTLEHVYKTLQSADLLCLDEFGYLPLDLESGQMLFNVISNAYERQALIITTNLPFSEWGPMFSDDQLAAAFIDRIVHYGHLIKTGNKDWRLEHSLMIDRWRSVILNRRLRLMSFSG